MKKILRHPHNCPMARSARTDESLAARFGGGRRTERAAGKSPQDALQTAALTSGRAVLISGLTVPSRWQACSSAATPPSSRSRSGRCSWSRSRCSPRLPCFPRRWPGWDTAFVKAGFRCYCWRAPAGVFPVFLFHYLQGVMRWPVWSLVLAGGFLIALGGPGQLQLLPRRHRCSRRPIAGHPRDQDLQPDQAGVPRTTPGCDRHGRRQGQQYETVVEAGRQQKLRRIALHLARRVSSTKYSGSANDPTSSGVMPRGT